MHSNRLLNSSSIYRMFCKTKLLIGNSPGINLKRIFCLHSVPPLNNFNGSSLYKNTSSNGRKKGGGIYPFKEVDLTYRPMSDPLEGVRSDVPWKGFPAPDGTCID